MKLARQLTRTRSSRTTSTPSTSAAAATASRPRRRATSASTSSELTPSEAAYLAGIINGPPSSTTPGRRRRKAAARARWTYVLDGMVGAGLAARRRARRGAFPKVKPRNAPDEAGAGDQTEYLLGMVRGGGQGLRHQRAGLPARRLQDLDHVRPGQDPRRGAVAVTDVLGPRKSWPSRHARSRIATIDASRRRRSSRCTPATACATERGDAGHHPGGIDLQAVRAGRPPWRASAARATATRRRPARTA